jgi:hypothetical protein
MGCSRHVTFATKCDFAEALAQLVVPLDRPQVHDRNSTTQAERMQPNVCPQIRELQADRKPLTSHVATSRALTCRSTAELGFRRPALAGQGFATPEEITLATGVATCRLNARVRSWVWAADPVPHVTDATPSPTESKERSARVGSADAGGDVDA